jgi:hypothetical protein
VPDVHKNFAYSTVATAPSPATSGTSLVVATGDGAKFPQVPFNATVWATAAQPSTTNAEIVRVTAISTDTLTIVRAQEGSTARTVVIGDQIAATITAKTLTDVERDIGAGNALGPAGTIAESFPRATTAATSSACPTATGVMYMTAVYIPAGVTITSISFMNGGTALATGTHQIFGLYDDNSGTSSGTPRALLRGTSDDTSTAWAGTTAKTLNLTSTYTTTRSGFYYVGVLIAATTIPTLACQNPAQQAAISTVAPILHGTTGSALTALPNPAAALAANSLSPYCWLT